MKASMLLCDAAEQVNGKLFVLGGGWNQAVVTGPLTMALAILIEVPWDQTNRQMTLRARLLDQDGVQVVINDQPILAEGQMEVGRPPGVKPGSDLNAAVALKFEGVPLTPGGYVWVLTKDTDELARTPFTVNAP